MYTDTISDEMAKAVGLEYDATYGELIDSLFVRYNIVIMFDPAFTYALQEHVAYYYTVYQKTDEGKLKILIESRNELSSFNLAIKDIVTELKEKKYI